MTTNDNQYVEFDNHVIFTYINQWENHSIAKIQLAAQQVRNDVKQLFMKQCEEFDNLLSKMNKQMDTNSNYNRNLDKTTKQLTKLRQDLANFSSSIHLEQEKSQLPIYLIKLSYKNKKQIQPTDQKKNAESIDVPGTESLSASTLNTMSLSKQKQMLGERLFVLVQQIEPHLAAKMTGMFLELDNKYVWMLITSEQILKAKIKEARSILEAHRYRQQNVIQS